MDTKIKFNLDNINVSDIMKQIHENLANRGYDTTEIEALAKGINPTIITTEITKNDALSQSIGALSRLGHIEYWWVMPRENSFTQRIKTFIKKINRKLLYFYLKHCFDQQNLFNNEIRGSITGLYEYAKNLEKTVSLYEEQISDVTDKIKEIELKMDNPKSSNSGFKDESSFDYTAFEENFRGSEQEISKRQQQYLEFFKEQDNVIDIGCGRGEFLSILKENNISAIGVDLTKTNIDKCFDKGLDAYYGDGINYLKGCEDNSLGGIFCAQVIEHLPTEKLVELIDLAYLKLKSGSHLVLETLNPKCLMIYAESMYLDPTHTTPVHPDTVEFFAKQAGFKDIDVRYSCPSDKKYNLPLFKDNSKSDLSIITVNNLLFGNREYALVARK